MGEEPRGVCDSRQSLRADIRELEKKVDLLFKVMRNADNVLREHHAVIGETVKQVARLTQKIEGGDNGNRIIRPNG